MAPPLTRICVFCGSQPGYDAGYRDVARELGRLLVERNIALVFGGGHVGMMGAIAEAVLTAGGHAIGVIPEGLMRRELAYEDLSELIVTRTMHERKQIMADLSDGFIALPGGFGTFEEFCEIVTWAQLGLHEKPCGLLNVRGYYDAMLRMFDHALQQGFLRPEHYALVLTDFDPAGLLAKMQDWQPPPLKKWLSPEAA
ncbi:MAG TPA: TIGR00730 family Rossman fold protein [Burkholderiales bacterium]|nr:TIGR00730 family Rossman fold protein [Burkholderiales bacterium]